MPQTTEYDAFVSYILKSLSTLIVENDGNELSLIGELTKLTNNVRGEARKNLSEERDDHLTIRHLFIDLSRKVKKLESKLFDHNDYGIQYKMLKSNIICAKENGTLEEIFAFHIYESFQEIEDCFADYLRYSEIEIHQQRAFFTLANPDRSVLKDAFSQLIRFGLMAANTDFKDFVDVFTGRGPMSPVIWVGGYNSLAYFIRGLRRSKVLNSIGRRSHWDIVLDSFETPEGRIPSTNSLRNSDPPKDLDRLDEVITTFRESII